MKEISRLSLKGGEMLFRNIPSIGAVIVLY